MLFFVLIFFFFLQNNGGHTGQSWGEMTGWGWNDGGPCLNEYKESRSKPLSAKIQPEVCGRLHSRTPTPGYPGRSRRNSGGSSLGRKKFLLRLETKGKYWVWDFEAHLGQMLRRERDMCAVSMEPQPPVLAGEVGKEIGVMRSLGMEWLWWPWADGHIGYLCSLLCLI